MNDLPTAFAGVSTGRFAHVRVAVISACLLAAACVASTSAGDHPGFGARAGLDPAVTGAQVWATDAYLVYVENDDDLDQHGASPRWGYLYYSPSLQKSRAYSIRDGNILVAEDLDIKFEAPAVSPDWIDSAQALEVAEHEAGMAFRRDHDGQLSTMLLMRGAFQTGDPDPTTWTIIYSAPHAASLFVVVDAAAGKVRRTWRG